MQSAVKDSSLDFLKANAFSNSSYGDLDSLAISFVKVYIDYSN